MNTIYTLDATEAASIDEAAEALVLAFTVRVTPQAQPDALSAAELASLLAQADTEAASWETPDWM